ncbi:outer membrane beta-barrel protein [Sphingomonas sp. HF-S4]|uniref:Outer membrane beta-barrel protein n=1 Tax=Sphingomonas agrestis TaxID=3080540 RepID=A0ABU3Y8P2_9SPHN|nr:outer membrane beta-barrel protein [Sphingomonas sp. HF-S4]MDV3457761.1 outer membrane beta-barrel protein [Sphingomonas sp. HF-S4]
MRKLVFVAALAASSALAAPAFAQDSAPGGFRVGVVGGLDIVRPGDSENSRIQGDDQSIEGALYGVEAGYDIPLGGAILGIEGEFSGSTAKVTTDTSDPNYFGYGRVKAGRDIYVGARLGFEAAPGTLVYAKGGYTNARLNVTADNGTTTRDENFQLDGWRVGAGVEKSIGRNTYAKVEYRYSNYTNADFQFANGTVTDTFDVDTDRHQVVAGVGFRF